MDILINKDIFECDCDAMVIPISTVGTISNSFNNKLYPLLGDLKENIPLGNYQLGDIQTKEINTHHTLKYFIFACSVESDHSSYTAIRELGRKIASFVNSHRNIHRIATPILGTGVGGLGYTMSYNILFNAFNECTSSAKLHFYIPDTELYHKITQFSLFEKTPSSRLAFDAELPAILNKRQFKEMIVSKEFYYELASNKFEEFFRYEAPDKDFFSGLLEDLRSVDFSFSKLLVKYQDDTEKNHFLTLCGELVAYTDYRAYLKNVWNKYPDKRVLAMANVWQNNWIDNLIKYKANDNDISVIKTANNIRNAILYYLKPVSNITMLSESHRAKVCKNLLLRDYFPDTVISEIFDLFTQKKVLCHNSLNNGALYTLILYSPTIKPLWLDEPRKFTLAGKISPDIREIEAITSASKIIHNNILTGEETLDLGNCGLFDLSDIPELAECTHLRTLILSNTWAKLDPQTGDWKQYHSGNEGKPNQLYSLAGFLEKLTGLETLICGGDWFEESSISHWGIKDISTVSKLTNLRHLDLSNNNITHINAISALVNLESLQLNNNRIKNISHLQKLKNLRLLFISNNKIKDVSPLQDLPNIATVDLHSNQISTLQPLEELIKRLGILNASWNLDTINVAKNPLESPPVETIITGKDAVIQYFEDIRVGKKYINKDIKFILVGNSEVGKTTLAKHINHKIDLNKPHSATHWMEEFIIESQYPVKRIKGKCKIRLFDFGGHDYFHDTHHMFYSTNTIYILLWDKETNRLNCKEKDQLNHKHETKPIKTQDYPLDYWLESVKFFIKDANEYPFEFLLTKESYNSYVLVAQNKVSQIEDIVHMDNAYYFRKYPFIYDFINMSIIKKDAKKERNMDYFDTMVTEMLDKTQIVGTILPEFYGIIKKDIETSYIGKPIMSLKEFHEYCNSQLKEPINQEQCKYLTSYLKQIGIILWNRKNPEAIYINKKWIIRNIYKVLEELSAKKGEFNLQHVINSIDGEPADKEKDAADLIQVMLDFTMIFEHPYCKKYIAPLYLPEIPDELVNMFVDKNAKVYRRIKYSGFIHKHIILSFFHEYSKLIWGNTEVNKSSYYYWKDAIIIKDPASGEIVMIQFHLGGNDGNAFIDITKLNIYTHTTFAEDIVKYLHEINTGYETEEMVTVNGKDYVPLSVIHKNEESENYTFLYNNKYYKLGDFKQYLQKTNQMKKIFISYSKQDLTIVNRFTDHLATLRRDGKISHWYCTELLCRYRMG